MRKVLLGGLLGALPGTLIVLVPMLLHEAGVITSDQAQIGFIGVPLMFIGVVIGTSIGAGESGHVGAVMLGVAGGFVIGLAGGLVIATVGGVPLIWLFLAPAVMIAGGALGARLGDRNQSHPTNHGNEPPSIGIPPRHEHHQHV